MNSRTISCLMLALFYGMAGVLHLVMPGPFVAIVPPWVPMPAMGVLLTGCAEIAGAIGIVQTHAVGLRKAAAWGLAAYALCVWPANAQHMLIDMARSGHGPGHGLGLAYHLPRLALQPVLIWWPLWAARVRA